MKDIQSGSSLLEGSRLSFGVRQTGFGLCSKCVNLGQSFIPLCLGFPDL